MVMGKNKRKFIKKTNINRKILICDVKIKDGNHTIDKVDNLDIKKLINFLEGKYK